jgi:glycine oxidase
VKSWDTIIVGGGIIGLTLAIWLRKQGLRVLVVERGEPGREASYAAAGMLSGVEIPLALKPLTEASARMYPEFAHQLQDESGTKVDLRNQGTILLSPEGRFPEVAEPLSHERLRAIEPALGLRRDLTPRQGQPATLLDPSQCQPSEIPAAYLGDRSVDPRGLVAAALRAARHRGVDISSGSEVRAVATEGDRVTGVQTDRTSYAAPIVVNCAGAWAGCIGHRRFPVRPVKGQMLALLGGPRLEHVLHADHVYLVPRSDGRIIVGSTLENAGYNKQTDVNTIQRLFQAALELVPMLSQAKKHEDWAGLRPGTPDDLPILGETATRGYFLASGHYRNGILLAPITAQAMTELILKQRTSHDLTSFSPARFGF